MALPTRGNCLSVRQHYKTHSVVEHVGWIEGVKQTKQIEDNIFVGRQASKRFKENKLRIYLT
jgi:hypothetical protein